MKFEPKQPVFFNKLPATENSLPNANVIRHLDPVNGVDVVEIKWQEENWIVRADECMLPAEAFAKKAAELHAKIEEAKKVHTKRKDVVAALGVCDTTFRRWCKIIKSFLPGAEQEPEPKAAS